MRKYNAFIFEDYLFDEAKKTLELHYSFDGSLRFSETYCFDFDFVEYDKQALDRAAELLFFMAGVSYFKAYLPPKIEIKKGTLDTETAGFLSKTYQRGLGEFFYVNKLDPNTTINFPVNSNTLTAIKLPNQKGLLVGVGGGKDSLVSIELLRDKTDISTWRVGQQEQFTPLVERIGLPHYWVKRHFDHSLLELNSNGAFNGHIPISAILACAGTVLAILSGHRDIVVSNEQSANDPTLTYQGATINHQYSKSSEFEQDYKIVLKRLFDDSIRYYSLLRPLSELYVAKKFAEEGFEKYKDVFSSCNRAFARGGNHVYWDGTCPKCAFIFLVLTPFVERQELENIFNGKNLLLDPELEATYRQLLGIEGDKPLECVGEIRESRTAMAMAQKVYPELNKYKFEPPVNYDYQALYSHNMPDNIYNLIEPGLLNA